MDLNDLILNGFVIYPQNNSFMVKKIAVSTNSTIFDPTEFATYEEALNFAFSKLRARNEWQPIIRYNNGLGIQYKNRSKSTRLNSSHIPLSRMPSSA